MDTPSPVPDPLLEALPIPAGVSLAETPGRLEISLPRRALGDRAGAGLRALLLGTMAMVTLFTGTFLSDFYATRQDFVTSGDFLFVVVPVLTGLLPVLRVALRRRANRVRLTARGLELDHAEGPLSLGGSQRQRLRADARIHLVAPVRGQPAQLVQGEHPDTWTVLLPDVADRRVGDFLALRLERHRRRLAEADRQEQERN